MSGIAILCPSRGRPQRFAQMLRSALATASSPDRLVVHLLIDDDDRGYVVEHDDPVVVHIAPRVPGPVRLESAWRGTGAPIIFAGADDIVFRTVGWDDALRNALAVRGPMAVAPNDGSGTNKWTHFAVNRRWLEVVGHLTPAFEHFCVDTYVEQIAKAAGRWAFLKDVLVQHVHKKYDRTLNDATYAAKRVRGPDGLRPSDRDEAKLRELRPQIEQLAARVRAAAYEPRWKGGTFTTAQIDGRLEELLSNLLARADADRTAGRLPAADLLEELEEVVRERLRLSDNSVRAALGSAKARA